MHCSKARCTTDLAACEFSHVSCSLLTDASYRVVMVMLWEQCGAGFRDLHSVVPELKWHAFRLCCVVRSQVNCSNVNFDFTNGPSVLGCGDQCSNMVVHDCLSYEGQSGSAIWSTVSTTH